MYALAIRPELDKTFAKLSKRNPKQVGIILRKAGEIVKNPHHYKNLRSPLSHLKRVHIDASFVLTFSVDENTKTVMLEDYAHHDDIYQV